MPSTASAIPSRCKAQLAPRIPMSVRSPSAVTGTMQIPVGREGSFWTAPVWTPERVSSLRSARPSGSLPILPITLAGMSRRASTTAVFAAEPPRAQVLPSVGLSQPGLGKWRTRTKRSRLISPRTAATGRFAKRIALFQRRQHSIALERWSPPAVVVVVVFSVFRARR